MRGPEYKGFSKGGRQAAFHLSDCVSGQRVIVVESEIDAMSLATLENWLDRTAYVST